MQKTSDEKDPLLAAPLLAFSPRARRTSLTRSLSSMHSGSHHSLSELLAKETLCSSIASESPVTSYRSNSINDSDIYAHVVKYDGDQTSQETIAAYIIKFEPNFYVRLHQTCSNFPLLALTYRAHNDPKRPSQRRGSLLGINNKPIATGKFPPLSSKTNPDFVLGKGHIMRDAYLQYKSTIPTDNNVPGGLPIDLNQIADQKLTAIYREKVSEFIENVYMFNQLVCWEEKVLLYEEQPDRSYTPTGKRASKFFIQEAERLYSIINNIKGGNYEFISADETQLCFGFNDRTFQIKITELIAPPGNDKFNSPRPIHQHEDICDFTNFDDYVHHHALQDLHAPIWELQQNHRIPVMTWCGIHGHITGDNDPQHFAIPLSMPRIAYYGIFNGKTAEPAKFINGLKLLLARLKCKKKRSFQKYINKCDFEVHEYISPKEISTLLRATATFRNYLDKRHPEYGFYCNFVQALEETLKKYSRDPNLLKLIGEADLFTVIVQHIINHPMSYHGAEELNVFAGEFGVILSCLPGTIYSTEPFFAITENEESYLALLFSDKTILQSYVFGVNQKWLNNVNNPALNEGWLDLLEIQALRFAQKNKSEFELYKEVILHRIDRRRNGQDTPRIQDEQAMLKVDDRLSTAQKNGYTSSFKTMQLRVDALYKKHQIAVEAVQKSIEDGLNEIALEERHLSAYRTAGQHMKFLI